MPHFIIDCSPNVLQLNPPEETMQAVSDAAASTGLFAVSGSGGIKVRLNPFPYYLTVNSKDDFIHVFANIMEGRTKAQKAALSRELVSCLALLFPTVPIISMNVREFEKATYFNKSMR